MSKLISNLAATVLALSLTLICGSVLAADKQTVNAKPKISALQSKKAPSFLFVVDARQGEIQKDKNGQFHLVLKHVDMNRVIMFSDRPNRIVKIITAKQLQSIWKVGKDSFEKDPPNAVLSGVGVKTQIVILNGIHVNQEGVTYPISVSTLNGKKSDELKVNSRITNVVLVIDKYPTR